jgi:hypothetical protein
MSSIVSKFFPTQAVIASTIAFMILNTFLPLPFSLQAEATEYPFKLEIMLEKSTFKLGEFISIKWILTNIGDENITLYTSIDRLFDFRIRDKNFKHIYHYWSDHGSTLLVEPRHPMKPGTNRTITDGWKQIFDGTYRPEELRLEYVPLGIYYVEGIFHSPTYALTIETPMIQITIL